MISQHGVTPGWNLRVAVAARIGDRRANVVARNSLYTVAPPSWRLWPARCRRYGANECQPIFETLH
jgi:hypothetical protein